MVEVQNSPVHFLTGVLWGDGGQLLLGDLPSGPFNHALCMFIAQFGAGADDSLAKPFTEDLQRWTGYEGECFSAFSFTQPFIRTDSTDPLSAGFVLRAPLGSGRVQRAVIWGATALRELRAWTLQAVEVDEWPLSTREARARPSRRLEAKGLLEAFS